MSNFNYNVFAVHIYCILKEICIDFTVYVLDEKFVVTNFLYLDVNYTWSIVFFLFIILFGSRFLIEF